MGRKAFRVHEGVAARSRTFVDHVLCHPRYMSICDHVLLPNCADYPLGFGIHDDLGIGGGYLGVVERGEPWKRIVNEAGE
ncbi:MAG: hypothetical protein QF570_16200 [Myxococcota bacterium]|nr:hypothetical protein [Myxococcota bacterium]